MNMNYGHLVTYKLSSADASTMGLSAGDKLPAMVIRWHASDLLNLLVFGDGTQATLVVKYAYAGTGQRPVG